MLVPNPNLAGYLGLYREWEFVGQDRLKARSDALDPIALTFKKRERGVTIERIEFGSSSKFEFEQYKELHSGEYRPARIIAVVGKRKSVVRFLGRQYLDPGLPMVAAVFNSSNLGRAFLVYEELENQGESQFAEKGGVH